MSFKKFFTVKEYSFRVKFFVILCIYLITIVTQTSAQLYIPEVKVGMAQGDVLKIFGAPADKVENETKRREIWSYPNRKLIFIKGKLAKQIFDGADKNINGADSQQNKKITSYNEKDTLNFSEDEVRSVFEQISAEGGGPDSQAGLPQAGGVPITAPGLVGGGMPTGQVMGQ